MEELSHKPDLGAGAAAPLEVSEHEWRSFLSHAPIESDPSPWETIHSGKTILVAGAGGSIGSHLARRLAGARPRLLILLDNSEHNLYQIHAELSAAPGGAELAPVLADICDPAALDDLFERLRPDLVYHAAAFKHVPLVERNPLAGLRNNVLGTWVLAKTAARHHAAALVALSTDKAANPRSVLGASKRMAELVLLALNDRRTRVNSLRLGNVLGSHGSVVPLFLEQIARGGPVTVTHPEVQRFFLTLDESIRLIMAAATHPEGGNLFAPELGEPICVAKLAEFLIRRAGFTPGKEIAVAFTGLRPGDKMSEELVSIRESKAGALDRWLYRVDTPALAPDELEECIEELGKAAERWDEAAGVAVACRMVPEYRPSAELQREIGARRAEVQR